MTEEQKQKKRKELEDEILLALLIGLSNNAEIKAATAGGKVDLAKFPEQTMEEAKRLAKTPEMDEVRKLLEDSFRDEGSKAAPTSQLESTFKKNIKAAAQAQVVKLLAAVHLAEYFEVIGVDDEKQCEACKALQGKIFTTTGLDPRYPKLDKMLIDNGLHPNCRCYVHIIKAPKITTKDLTTMAMNATNISDEVLYTKIDGTQEDDIPTYSFGESLVQLAPVGTFEGTAPDGSGREEIIDDVAIDMVVSNYDGKELLLDIDHKSMKGRESDTIAAGWIYDLKQVSNLGRLDGLYGRIKWTELGRQLIETRKYRFISPVFKLATDGRPYELVNAGLTNRPALETISPILNSKKDEKDNIVIMKTEDTEKPAEKEADEKKEETKEACNAETAQEKEVCNEQKLDEKADGACENQSKTSECDGESDVQPAEAANAEASKAEETTAEQPKEDGEARPEEQKEEVIKLEVLNSVPEKKLEAGPQDKMRIALGLKGKAFFDYLKANPDLKSM